MEDVGLFQAANSLTSQYVGVVLSALAMDYFPRLSEVQHDNVRMAQVVNRQAEVVSLITAPLCMALIATAPWVIRILLTDEYLPAVPMMRWLGLGILLQLIQFPLGYVYAAKGNKKVFFWLEAIWGNMVWLICSVGFFYWSDRSGREPGGKEWHSIRRRFVYEQPYVWIPLFGTSMARKRCGRDSYNGCVHGVVP